MLCNKPFGIALTATVSELLSIRCMEAIKWALSESLTGERLHFLPVVVARLAEMMSTEAEPSCSLAAVAALVHDIVGSMFCAVSHSNLDTVLLAETADEVFWLSFVWLFFDLLITLLYLFIALLLSDTCSAVPHSTVVRQFALVALVVLEFEESKFFKLVVKLLALLGHTLTFVETLNDCLMLHTILDHFVHSGSLLHDFVSLFWEVFFLSHLLIASRAINEVAVDCVRWIPLTLDLGVETVSVENVLA